MSAGDHRILERIAAWQRHRGELSEAESEGDYPRPGAWHASDDTAVALLEELAGLFDQTRAIEPDGAQLVAVLGVWTRSGVTFPLHPDENASDWWLLGSDSMSVSNPDELRDWALEVEQHHATDCGTANDSMPAHLDDCVAIAAGYRLLASLMDVWHEANPPLEAGCSTCHGTRWVPCDCLSRPTSYSNVGPDHDGSPDECPSCDMGNTPCPACVAT